MSSGWSGQILRIDLSKKESLTEAVAPYTRSFIGGRGINVKIMYDEVDPKIAPFDPANRLLLGPGVLAGTPAPAAGRMKVTTMCPNGFLASSGIGGFIGAEIRHAGYDNIIIQGKSGKPVYLYIHDDSVEFRDASHIWGKDTWETQQIIRREIGDPDVQVMCIGPGGENLVSFACIMTGIFSAAGHGGTGAIMGSKNLKAIAARGRRGIEIANLEEFLKVSLEMRNAIMENPDIEAGSKRGQRDAAYGLVKQGLAVFGNWEDAEWDEATSEGFHTGAEEFWERYAIGKVGCSGCPMYRYCIFSVPGIGIGAPKCVGWGAFGPQLWNKDCKFTFHAASLCNQYGLDFSSTANLIAFLMELYHRGIITEQDTDGIAMRRGDKDAIISTIHKMARQEGFGKLLRDGVLKAARTIGKGAEEYAMHVKGLEMEAYEYRAYKAYALAAVVCTKDPLDAVLSIEFNWVRDKETAEKWAVQLLGTKEAAYPPSYEKKSLMVWKYENIVRVIDMLGVCHSPVLLYNMPSLEIPAKLFSLATGVDTSGDELLTVAHRVQTLERAFNVMRGIRRKDDTLPKRMFETTTPGGRFKGESLEKEKFDRMVNEFYALCGWDEDGIPKEETFKKFGLSSEWQVFRKKLGKEMRTHG